MGYANEFCVALVGVAVPALRTSAPELVRRGVPTLPTGTCTGARVGLVDPGLGTAEPGLGTVDPGRVDPGLGTVDPGL